jgi:transcriptional regulator with XRE-family HTH domain
VDRGAPSPAHSAVQTTRRRVAPSPDHSTEEPGQRLRRARERLDLRYRDVEEASQRIAERHGNPEFAIALSRLADIENKGTVPTIYRLYSLCAIYRLDFQTVLRWYGTDLARLPSDALAVAPEQTHLFGIPVPEDAEAVVPLAFDPGFDIAKTTLLSRMVQTWGRLPLALLSGLEPKNHRYGFLGTEDWSMHPLLQPGSLILVDESRKKIVNSGWANEFERPIYFLEHRDGYACSWCHLSEEKLVLQPHPSSRCDVRVYAYPAEIDVIGQVVGIAMRLGPDRKRRSQL